ncbi:heterokaryon incompatibility protein-domain-containing protein [Podospora didyma]|uniref:Heterokaryon incompatibility protein-domain-containing protein n=1 Tax=Podospora didyma TaxID=330526 RepID=A0AAE0N347_9PEZI|nr:heterokaryon incompatibility protein-domain-containing protein [Podospora didyma]
MADPPISQLCTLCRQFSDDIISFSFVQQNEYHPSSRWIKDPTASSWQPWGDAFQHSNNGSLDALAASAQTCDLCRLVYDELSPEGPDECTGALLFHPFGGFIARFTGSEKMRTRSAPWVEQPHQFQFCRRRSRLPGIFFGDKELFWQGKKPSWHSEGHAIPRDGTHEDVFETARWWLRECVEGHDSCKRATKGEGATLPTRVIDVGVDASGVRPTLHVPAAGEFEPYAVLTHCWGGAIPFKTTLATLQDRINGMNMEQLPRNFQDAITITRRLGLRYIWIDALCIVQDDAADWEREASKMADIYTAGHVTISALDSPSSNAGILRKNRGIPEAILSSEYTLRKTLKKFDKVLTECPLNTRGWCLQEKLLSPALIHFGAEQIYWECRRHSDSEADPLFSRSSTPSTLVRPFMGLNAYVSQDEKKEPSWNLWYLAVEEFSKRNLTFGTDKFPAMAGVGARFKEVVGSDVTYLAGLWAEDLAQGLCWGPAWRHLGTPNRKATGFDKCTILSKPAFQVAPSWSWASVDGHVHFYLKGDYEHWSFTILGVDMDRGKDDLMAQKPFGTLTIKGLLAPMWYLPRGYGRDNADYERALGHNVGSLAFTKNDKDQFPQAMLDFDRETARECWGMVAYGKTSFKGILILEERGMHFVRIGFCNDQRTGEFDTSRFKEMVVTLV